MDTGIRPPARVCTGGNSEHGLETRFNAVLDRVPLGLALPAGKPGPVVRTNAFPAFHNSVAGTASPGMRPSR
jgi:hypothetical protein